MSDCWAFRSAVAAAAAAATAAAVTLLLSPLGGDRLQAGVHVSRRDHMRRFDFDRHRMTPSREHADSDSARVLATGDFDGHHFEIHGSNNGSGIVRLFSDAIVRPGERVDGDVVAVFGSVRVEGEVDGAAVAVFGSLDLGHEAVVHGDAVAVGGTLRQSEGSKVSGQSVMVGFLPLTLGLPGLPMVLATILLAWLVSMFFGWIAAALFPDRLARVAITSSRRTAASLLLGIASGPLMIMTTLLLVITVVGIPLALLLPLVYCGVLYTGNLAATYVLGCKLTRRRLGSPGVTAPLMAGSLLVASIFGFGTILWETPGVVRTVALFFLLVGVLLVIGLSSIGAGAFLLSRAGARPHNIDGAPAGSAPSPAPGPPGRPAEAGPSPIASA